MPQVMFGRNKYQPSGFQKARVSVAGGWRDCVNFYTPWFGICLAYGATSPKAYA